ncbi:MAG: transcriptional regulator [Acidobacteria bacterium]|nr:MAG: transcriptional regulator [Acidobacteriota bacterium]
MSDPVSRDVGRRLRAIRRQQGLSLDDVEERSGGKWSSSAIGAYERGYRTLTVERLRSLADFYGVPISVLLAPAPKRDGNPEKVVIDLVALEQAGADFEPLQRLAHSIQMQRGDFNGKILTIRGADVSNLSLLYGITEEEMLEKLGASGVALNLDDSLEDSIEEPATEADTDGSP